MCCQIIYYCLHGQLIMDFTRATARLSDSPFDFMVFKKYYGHSTAFHIIRFGDECDLLFKKNVDLNPPFPKRLRMSGAKVMNFNTVVCESQKMLYSGSRNINTQINSGSAIV